MHTISRPEHSETLTEGRPAEVDAFLETLSEEQAKFLASVRQASSLLSRESGQLAHLAAIHSRLTQQFFDAQRLILTRRAEFDAQVALIQSAAPDEFDTDAPSARHEIAALGVTVIRTKADVDALASVIEDAFSPDEPDGTTPQRQLALLLDGWWAAENREGQAAIELARTRAEMMGHVARIEADEVVSDVQPASDQRPARRPTAVRCSSSVNSFEPLAGDDPTQSLPPIVCELLDEADAVNLETLLTRLAESLSTPIIPMEQVATDPRPREVEVPEASRDFWTDAPSLDASRRSVRWFRGTVPPVSGQGRHDRR